MGRRVGIDLGTTNTVVAIADGKSARVLRNREGEELTLSVVGVPRRGGAGDLLVGTPAYRNWKSMPKDTVLSVKRLMGRGSADEAVKALKSRVLYDIKTPESGTDQSLRVVIGGAEHSPVDISAKILAKVKADAEARLDGEAITHAVITVPAYFSQVQRKATRDAARRAGLEVIQILDEPTAAAVAFGLERGDEDPRMVLVYDFGGGTFDISILTWAGKTFAPMNLEGDMWLGGDDLDDVIVDMIARHVKKTDGVDIRSHASLLVEVKQEARKLKEALTAADSADILITSAEVDIDFCITRTELELAILDKVATYRPCGCGQNNAPDATACHACGASISHVPEADGRAIALVRRALANACLTIDDIDCVLLAGNSTLVPLVRQAVERVFGGKIKAVSHPKLVVAQGAAIVAAQVGERVVCAAWIAQKKAECGFVNAPASTMCAGCGAALNRDDDASSPGDTDITVGSVAPFDYVLGLTDDRTFPFVEKNDVYPTPDRLRKWAPFQVQQRDQQVAFLPVYGQKPDERESQGKAYVRLPDERSGDLAVEVSMWLDVDGTFQVAARTGAGQPLQVLHDKGEGISHAADALEEADKVLEDPRNRPRLETLKGLRALREQTLAQLFGLNPEQAVQTAAQMRSVAQEWGGFEMSDRERAADVLRFADWLLRAFAWGFDAGRLAELQRAAEALRAALRPRSEGGFSAAYETLDELTDDLPGQVQAFMNVYGDINHHVAPTSPAQAKQLHRSVEAARRRFETHALDAHDVFDEVERQVASARAARPAVDARDCRTCGRTLDPGARYCPVGHDSWLLHLDEPDPGRGRTR